jgi:hypothetical protein
MQRRMQQFWKLLRKQQPVEHTTASIETKEVQSDTQQPTALDTHSIDTYHQECSTLKYNIFLEILLHGTLSLLVISGNPSPIELNTAWQGILHEYIDDTQNDRSSTLHEVWKKMLYTSWLISFIDWSVYALKYNYSEKIALMVAEAGFYYIQPIEDRARYLTQIYMLETEAKSLVVRLNQLNNEYKLLCPTAIDQETRTLADYEKEIAILSKFMGQRIVKAEITVKEFAAIVNLYNETNKVNQDGSTNI